MLVVIKFKQNFIMLETLKKGPRNMSLMICSWLKKKNGLADLNYAQLEAAYQGIVA